MADINYTGNVYLPDSGEPDTGGRIAGDAPESGPSSLGALTSVVGAMASLALVAGVGVWGYKLMVRDVSGVPVVRALEGPMRIQPVDPGGQQADHQGLAVNAVAAAGTAAPTANRLMLAPRPVELTDEDASPDKIAEQAEQAEQARLVSVKLDEIAAADPAAGMSIELLVEQLTSGVEPISGKESPIAPMIAAPVVPIALDVQSQKPLPDYDAADVPEDAVKDTTKGATEDTTADATAEVVEDVRPAVVTGPGLKRSLRPLSRPARAVGTQGGDTNLASAINAAVDTVASIEVNPDSLPAGTRLAQLGAYDSADIARAEWDKLNLRFEEYLEGKQRVIQKASSGGRTFYRLRAMGFDDLSAARRFCSALVSENTDCIPVTIR